jgi:patatin-like phospholipase/acyl hydrolase
MSKKAGKPSREDASLYEEAKRHVLKTRRILQEFPHYPKSWLNRLICFRYKLSDPVTKQIRDFCEFERKYGIKDKKTNIIIE